MQNRINTVGLTETWDLSFDRNQVFRAVSLHTNYAYDMAQKQPGVPTDNQHVVMDDDQVIIDEYLKLALARLKTILLVRCSREGSMITDNPETGVITIRLIMGENHPEDARDILQAWCRQFLIDRCIELWNKSSDEASRSDEEQIRHTLYLRKTPVSEFRKMHPMF